MKKSIYLFIVIFILVSLFTGCANNDTNNQIENYTEFSFADISWKRNAENDVETIRFGADGSFSYSCSCGNPVNDADLCEGYSYNDATKTITLKFIEETEDAVSTIEILKCDEKELHLDFDGDLRIFTK